MMIETQFNDDKFTEEAGMSRDDANALVNNVAKRWCDVVVEEFPAMMNSTAILNTLSNVIGQICAAVIVSDKRPLQEDLDFARELGQASSYAITHYVLRSRNLLDEQDVEYRKTMRLT